MIKSLSHIKPSPINEDIYSTTDLSDLELSLRQLGQLEPIVINPKGDIISGHRRYFSMMRLGWKECRVRVEEYENETIAIIQYNNHRVKSVSDINNEYRILEKEYKKSLGGTGTRTDLKEDKKKFNTMVDISKTIGVGTSKLKQIKSIYNYEPDLITKIDKGELSVNKAYLIVQKKYMKGGKDDDGSKKDSVVKFLKKNKPSVDDLVSALKDVYPYSTLNLGKLVDENELNDKRDELIDHMNFLKKLDEREIVIYKKLKEIEKSKFNKKDLNKISKNIFQFKDINDVKGTTEELKEIRPVLRLVRKNFKEFNILRVLIHSMEWSSNPGRNLKYIVSDVVTGKYLGVITIGSDVMSIKCRDDYIGWDKKSKIEKKRLNNIGIASTIVPVQPFGYNMLLGKLLASLCGSEKIRKDWKERYGDELVGMTTTSLYGTYSMYNSIPMWKKVGSSNGKIIIKPDDDHYLFWNDWVKKNYKDEFYHATHTTGPKQNVINLIFRKLNIPLRDYENEQEKGVYFCEFYTNTKKYLRGEIDEDQLKMKKIISDGNEYVMGWWIPKAEKRYKRLVKESSIETDTLWYEDINEMKVESWLRSRGVLVSTLENKKIDTRKVDRMFRKVGIDKNKFYESLITMGTDGLKTKQMKEDWSVDNPTKNNCYMVSEFIYKYLSPSGTKHLSIKVEGDTLPHHYLKWDDGTIIDLTAEQYEDYSKLDYSKGYSSGFIGKGVSKRTKKFGDLMGYKKPPTT